MARLRNKNSTPPQHKNLHFRSQQAKVEEFSGKAIELFSKNPVQILQSILDIWSAPSRQKRSERPVKKVA